MKLPPLLLLLAMPPLACGSDIVRSDGAATDSGGDTTTAPETTSMDTSASSSTSIGADEESGQTSVSFLGDHDVGSSWGECSIFTQDCPPGFKCMPYSTADGSWWNAWGCFELVDGPADPGETCTAEGGGISGIDTCALGSVCWNVDPDTNQGTCSALCLGSSEEQLWCDDPDAACIVLSDGVAALCIMVCHPLDDDCVDGSGCYPSGGSDGRFFCAPSASLGMGAAGAPCEYENACDPGFACLDAGAVPGCSSPVGCCSSWCPVGDDAPCPPDQTCHPWFDGAMVPAGYEDVGVCALP